MTRITSIAAALSDPHRVRVLLALRGGELCVCQLVELLGLAVSTVSRHISLLKSAGLVTDRKEGRWVYCRLAIDSADPIVAGAIHWATSALAKDPQAREDVARICCIVKENPEDLCKRQAKSRCCSSAPATRAAARWRKGGLATSRAT